jgi:Flp pilus assembly protein TadG
MKETIMSKSKFMRFLKAEQGVAAIEFSLIFPMMIFLFFGLVDMTQLISYSRKITSVADAVVGLVGQNRNAVTETVIKDYFKVAGMIMKPVSESEVRVRVFGYRLVGSTVTRVWTVDNNNGPNCSAAPSTHGLSALAANGRDLILVQACYTFEPYMGQVLGEAILGATSFDVEQVAIQSPRGTAKIDCYLTEVGGTACPK